MDVPTVFYYCLPSKYFKKLIFLVIVGVKLVSLSPNWNLKYFRMFIYKKNSFIFQMYWLEFFYLTILFTLWLHHLIFFLQTWTWILLWTLLIHYLEMQMVVFRLYIFTSSQIHCILLGRFHFVLWSTLKKFWSKVASCLQYVWSHAFTVFGHESYCMSFFVLHEGHILGQFAVTIKIKPNAGLKCCFLFVNHCIFIPWNFSTKSWGLFLIV